MRLSLGELESGSSAALTVLFPFFHPWIAGKESLLLKRQPELFFGYGQSFGNAVPNSSGLTRLATALYAGIDVVATGSIDCPQRLNHVISQRFTAEKILKGLAVYFDFSSAFIIVFDIPIGRSLFSLTGGFGSFDIMEYTNFEGGPSNGCFLVNISYARAPT